MHVAFFFFFNHYVHVSEMCMHVCICLCTHGGYIRITVSPSRLRALDSITNLAGGGGGGCTCNSIHRSETHTLNKMYYVFDEVQAYMTGGPLRC